MTRCAAESTEPRNVRAMRVALAVLASRVDEKAGKGPRVEMDDAAAEAGISRTDLACAIKIVRAGIEDLRTAVLDGRVSLRVAHDIAARVSIDAQGAILEQAIEARRAGRKLPAGTLRHVEPRSSMFPKRTSDTLSRIVANLSHTTEVVSSMLDADTVAVPSSERLRWLGEIDHTVRTLRLLRRRLQLDAGGVEE